MGISIFNNPTKKNDWVNQLRIAYLAAAESPDPSTQNGALIYLGDTEYLTACNDFLPGVRITEQRLQRPQKYFWMEHAERAAIFGALAGGASLQGKTLVCPWYACADCARAIVQAGIIQVVGHKPMLDGTPSHWNDSIDAAFTILEDSGVNMYWVSEPIPNAPKILFNGEFFDPSAP